MRDLFPNKRFNYTKINGIEYISKDILEMLIKQEKQEILKEIEKIIDKCKNKWKSGSPWEFEEVVKQFAKEIKQKLKKEYFGER